MLVIVENGIEIVIAQGEGEEEEEKDEEDSPVQESPRNDEDDEQ
jgi:hypothetical protein